MSNLIPTPRTDKNGRIIIRHMKDQNDDSKKMASFPHVAISTVSSAMPSDDTLVEMIFGSSPDPEFVPKFHKYLEALPLSDSGMISSFVALVGAGSPGGTETARRFLSVKLESAILYNSIVHPRYTGQLLRAWAIGDVREDMGLPFDQRGEFNIIEGVSGIRSLLQQDKQPHDDVTTDLPYWRGLTALYLTNLDLFAEDQDIETAKRFIEWAGHRDDIGAVVKLAAERAISDPAELEDLMTEMKGYNALGDGTL
jgi:hypothetical protein